MPPPTARPEPSGARDPRTGPDLRAQLAICSMAFDAAILRCDRALADGDQDGVAAALAEQRAVLEDTERRLSRAVAAAVERRCAPGR